MDSNTHIENKSDETDEPSQGISTELEVRRIVVGLLNHPDKKYWDSKIHTLKRLVLKNKDDYQLLFPLIVLNQKVVGIDHKESLKSETSSKFDFAKYFVDVIKGYRVIDTDVFGNTDLLAKRKFAWSIVSSKCGTPSETESAIKMLINYSFDDLVKEFSEIYQETVEAVEAKEKEATERLVNTSPNPLNASGGDIVLIAELNHKKLEEPVSGVIVESLFVKGERTFKVRTVDGNPFPVVKTTIVDADMVTEWSLAKIVPVD